MLRARVARRVGPVPGALRGSGSGSGLGGQKQGGPVYKTRLIWFLYELIRKRARQNEVSIVRPLELKSGTLVNKNRQNIYSRI